MTHRRFRLRLATAVCASLLAVAGLTAAPQAGIRAAEDSRPEIKDAWITGKLDALYSFNRQLNPFDIDTKVDGGIVYLTGSVETEVERDLAAELARSVDGVTEVRNELKVASASTLSATRRAERETLAKQRAELRRWVEDASTTAVVKSKLLANQNTKGLNIKVETRNKVVTLTGQVASSEEKQLAELLARNTENVAEVRNELAVDATRAARME
jgi:hyperosmotically inducible periplasmic protein